MTNPVLIGALTVLVAIVAVTLAYNASSGLPFVPTYDLHLQAVNASELTHGDDVNLGGARVGIVSSVVARRLASGRAIAVINVNLENSIKPLPVDSTFTVRLKGAIGLKYLQIIPGHARRGWGDGATVPLARESSEVDFDQVLSMFTPPTRTGVQQTTIGLGDALAGRGPDLNNAVGALVPLLSDLAPVAANLASSRTDLGGFFAGLDRYVRALAPVAAAQAQLIGNLDTTFGSLASVATPYLQQTIARTPPMFAATIAGGPVIRPFLTETASLLAELRPGAATLPVNAPLLAAAFAAGTRTLPGTAGLDSRAVALSRTLGAYSANPTAAAGLDRLTLTLSRLGPPLAFLTPVQSSCNDVTLFLRNTASVLSEHVTQGTLLRFVQVLVDDRPGAESEPSSHVYTGPSATSLGPLHVNPYPYTASPGQPAACAAGNEPYQRGPVLGNPSGHLPLSTELTRAPNSRAASTPLKRRR
jgi:ABC-type transporter Mla subunit MlaD